MRPPTPFATFVSLLLIGCSDDHLAGGTGAGNPGTVQIGVTMTARTSGPSTMAGRIRASTDGILVMVDSGGARFGIERMLASCDRIEIALPDGMACPAPDKMGGMSCGNGFLAKDSSVIFDLLDTNSASGGLRIAVPPGIYSHVALHLARAKSGSDDEGESDADIEGGTIAIAGTMTRNGVQRPFRMELRSEQTLDFKHPSGIAVGPGIPVRFAASVDPRGWMAGLDVGACIDSRMLPEGTDTLVLDASYPCGDLETESSEEARKSATLEDDLEE